MNIKNIAIAIMLFSFISIIFVFITALNIGVTNDYILYHITNTSEELYNQGMLSNYSNLQIQEMGNEYTGFNFQLDNIWFFAYLSFFISSIIVAYKSEKNNYFSFLGLLFYGTMFILFILTIFATLTEWFKTEVLLAILPTTILIMPKFYYYIDNIGVFSLVQLVICIVINMFDFDFSKIIGRKKQEDLALEDNEIV